MTYSLYEMALIAAILGGIAYIVWRGGAANPVGTRKLEGSVNRLSGKVSDLGKRVDKLDEDSASKADVARLKELIHEQDKKIDMILETLPGFVAHQSEMRANMAAIDANSRAAVKQIDRLYDFIVEKGLKS